MSTETNTYWPMLSHSSTLPARGVRAWYARILGALVNRDVVVESKNKTREVAAHRAREVIALAKRLDMEPGAINELTDKIQFWLTSDMRAGELAATAATHGDRANAPGGARVRAEHFVARESLNPDNFTLADAAEFRGCSDRLINEARQRGKLYAMVPAGKERGFQYPRWQFDADPDRLAAVLAPFVEARADCWVIHSFMMTASAALNERTPRDCILDPEFPLDSIVSLARRRFGADRPRH